jgi:hypothetical protein
MPLPLCVPDFAGRLPSAMSLTAGTGCGVGQEDDLRGGLSTGGCLGLKSKKGSGAVDYVKVEKAGGDVREVQSCPREHSAATPPLQRFAMRMYQASLLF